jgi:hypothetical protein
MTIADAAPDFRLRQRMAACLFWLLMAIGFGVSGWFFMWNPVIGAVGNWWQSRDYVATPATVFFKEARDNDGSFVWYGVRYGRGGREYETNRLSVLETDRIDEGVNATITRQLQNASITSRGVEVWVSPRRPDVAIVSRDLPLGSLWDRALVGVAFAAFTLAGIAGIIGTIFNTRFYRRQHDAFIVWLMATVWCAFSFSFFLLVNRTDEIVGIVVIGFFALAGAFLLYVAVRSSILGQSNIRFDTAAHADRSQLAKERKTKRAAKGNAKRGGLGGRGEDFDKD